MRTNQSKLRYGLVAACFVVSLAAVACGDDSSDGGGGTGGGAAGTGAGTGAGSGGSGGAKAGSGGGGSGGGPSVAMCMMQTNTATMNAIAPACNTCLCTMGTKEASACALDANCWALIDCIRKNCPDRTCATTTCSAYLGGATTAMPVGTLLGGPCMSACPNTSSGNDGGSPDAGI